jgi:hypothetical protein
LRFFTRKTACQLLEENGYAIVQKQETLIPFELALGWAPERLAMRFMRNALAAMTRLMPNLFGYQIVLAARSKQASNERTEEA